MANAILKSWQCNSFELVGVNWIDRFLHRHYELLQCHWSKPLNTVWAEALNPGTVQHWFERVLKPIVVDLNIHPENIFGIDEARFKLSDSGTQHVIGF